MDKELDHESVDSVPGAILDDDLLAGDDALDDLGDDLLDEDGDDVVEDDYSEGDDY